MRQVLGQSFRCLPTAPKGDRDPQGKCSQPDHQSSAKGDGGGYKFKEGDLEIFSAYFFL